MVNLLCFSICARLIYGIGIIDQSFLFSICAKLRHSLMFKYFIQLATDDIAKIVYFMSEKIFLFYELLAFLHRNSNIFSFDFDPYPTFLYILH